MTREELELEIKEICPEMLSHAHFMHVAECIFCKGIPNDTGKAIDDNEFESWHKLSEKLHTTTVKQLIDYLQANFKLDDKLCYMDYVQGYKNDCTYIIKDQLGKRFFYSVKDLKDRNMKKHNFTKDKEDDLYSYVNDNDVVVI